MTSYFELRNVTREYYADYTIPRWLLDQIPPVAANPRILDFGCGFGQLMHALARLGYQRVEGADVEPAAIESCRQRGHTVYDMRTEGQFHDLNRGAFDVVITQHVLEHIPKADVVGVATNLRLLLRSGGLLVVAVPNAQAFTGAYWAYEDFTHQTLYTSGGIYYVLRAAGFGDIRFLDIDCTSGLGVFKAAARRVFWKSYSAYYDVMCKLLASPTHRPSPHIFSYEIKVAARAT